MCTRHAALYVDAAKLERVRQKCHRTSIDLDACVAAMLQTLLDLPEPYIAPPYWEADATPPPNNVVPLRPRRRKHPVVAGVAG